MEDPISKDYLLSKVERGFNTGEFLPSENIWRTYYLGRYLFGNEIEDWMHLLDYNSSGIYTLYYTGLLPVTRLRYIIANSSAIVIEWDPPYGGQVYRVQVKLAGADDTTYVDYKTTAALIETITSLASGCSYVFRVYAGTDAGVWDPVGTIASGSTTGTFAAICGNGIVEPGELCEMNTLLGIFPSCCNNNTCLFVTERVCRSPLSSCDIAEQCNGTSALCPPDTFTFNTSPCDDENSCTSSDACSNGQCLGVNTCSCTSDANCTSMNDCVISFCGVAVNGSLSGRQCIYTNTSTESSFNEGLDATIDDRCDGRGVCAGVVLDCSQLDGPCQVGLFARGTCIMEPRSSITTIICRNSSQLSCDRDEMCTGLVCPADTGSSCIFNSVVQCNSTFEYESHAPNSTTDRRCDLLQTCNASTFESRAPQDKADRVCTVIKACLGIEFESLAPNSTRDRECKLLRICMPNEFEELAPTATTDRRCMNVTTCLATEFESRVPNRFQNRICKNRTLCTCSHGTATVASGSGATLCDAAGEDCSACARGYALNAAAVNGSKQTCGTLSFFAIRSKVTFQNSLTALQQTNLRTVLTNLVKSAVVSWLANPLVNVTSAIVSLSNILLRDPTVVVQIEVTVQAPTTSMSDLQARVNNNAAGYQEAVKSAVINGTASAGISNAFTIAVPVTTATQEIPPPTDGSSSTGSNGISTGAIVGIVVGICIVAGILVVTPPFR